MSLGQDESLPPFLSPGVRPLVFQDKDDAFDGVSVARLVFESCDGMLSLHMGILSALQTDGKAFDVGSVILCHIFLEILHCNHLRDSKARQ
jgi:hypothetical protein